MNTKVIKIGGSCLTSAEDIKKIVSILDTKDDIVIVISAFKNVTNLIEFWFDTKNKKYLDKLENKFKIIFENLFSNKKFKSDFLIFNEIVNIHKNNISRNHAQALGEKISFSMIEMYLKDIGISIDISDDDPLVFGDNNSFDLEKSSNKILDFFKSKKHRHILTQGFASIDANGELNNLRREGSDLTAVIWAYALSVRCILYKDVGAIYTDDPSKNKIAEKITKISFYDYKDKFYFSQIIQDRVIDFCIKYGLNISIHSFDDNSCGTKLYF